MRSLIAPVFMAASLTAFVAHAAPATSPAGLTKPQSEILAAEQGELAGWQARNIDAIMNAYTSDTRVITGGSPVRDYAALRETFVRFLNDPGFSLTFRSDPPIVAQGGDLGVATGTYIVTATDPATKRVVTSTGFHLLVWRKHSDGAWRIQRQLTTPSPHAAPIP